jgi:hypothetical protein
MARACPDKPRQGKPNPSFKKRKKVQAAEPGSGDEDSSTDEESGDDSDDSKSSKSAKGKKDLVTKISRLSAKEQGALVEKIINQELKKQKTSQTKLQVIKDQSKLVMAWLEPAFLLTK